MSVALCTPVKECAKWLPRYLQVISELDDISRYVFSYGKSQDATLEILRAWAEQSPAPVEVHGEPSDMRAVSSGEIGAIYRDFQKIVEDGDETHALLMDADIMKTPPQLVPKLMKRDVDIIAPYIYVMFHDRPGPLFYDSYVFRVNGKRFHPWSPPRNGGELYQIDSAGTCLLVKREPFLEVPYGDPYPHLKFCNDAREKGYGVWADPKLVILHLDMQRFGLGTMQVDVLKALMGRKDPTPYYDRTLFVTDSGDEVSVEGLDRDNIMAYVYGIVRK